MVGGGGANSGGTGGNELLGLGESCAVPTECASGFCADGVCCAEACGGACAACDAGGSCTPHATGTDPEDECDGGVCDGVGTCASGGFTWGQRFGDSANQGATAVATLSSGDVVIAGRAFGTVDFGTGDLTTGEMFVARLSPTGQAVWAFKWGDSGSSTVSDIAVDDADNIYVTARTGGAVTIGGETFEDSTPNTFDLGVGFIFKLNASGSVLWAKGFNDGSEATAARVVASTDGDVYLAGYYKGSPQVAGGPPLPSSSGNGIFFASVATTGTHAWSIGFPNAISITNVNDFDVAVDETGNVSAHARTTSAVSIAGQTVSGTFVVRFDSSGNATSVTPISAPCGPRRILGPIKGVELIVCASGTVFSVNGTSVTTHYEPPALGSSTAVSDASLDANGNIVMAGTLESPSDFGGGVLTSAGADDVLLVKLDATGSHLWSVAYGDDGNQCNSGVFLDCARRVDTDGEGNILLAGALQGTVSFGGPPLIVDGLLDIFVTKLTP